MKTYILLAAAGSLLALTASSHAFTLNWDGPGSTADAFAPINLTIGYGQYVPSVDGDGDSIPGSEHWEIDPSGGSVPVNDPSLNGYGTAPSGSKALDARDGTVLFVFNAPFTISSFSAVLDNSTFGDLGNTNVEFYDVNNHLLYSSPINETTPGFVINTGAITGAVKTIVLPANAYYDNVQVVPEPSALTATGCGLALLGMLRFRRRIA